MRSTYSETSRPRFWKHGDRGGGKSRAKRLVFVRTFSVCFACHSIITVTDCRPAEQQRSKTRCRIVVFSWLAALETAPLGLTAMALWSLLFGRSAAFLGRWWRNDMQSKLEKDRGISAWFTPNVIIRLWFFCLTDISLSIFLSVCSKRIL